jgi:dihydrodipicolinate synthase/N-acetylneuraminate lyase
VSEQAMLGVYTILVTPYDEQYRVDGESLQRLVEFNVQAGVHGLGVALGSEIVALSEAERRQVTRIVVKQARGRVPVVINTGGPVAELAVLYSRMAVDDGADALMVRPPTFLPAGPDQVIAYFKAISDAVHIPIFIQDTPETPVSGGSARRIAESCPNVRYIKVESLPPPYQVAQAVAACGDLLGVFGGAGGSFFVEELRRGAIGTMPSCSQPEAFVAVWDAYQRGDEQAAQQAMVRWILPVNRLATQAPAAFYHVHKEILRRRSVIRTANVRGPVAPLDPMTQRELVQVIEELASLPED